MLEQKGLAPLLAVLQDLMAWFRARDIQGVVMGGVAASLLGRPRMTRDVDVLVLMDEGQWGEFLTEGAKYGFIPRGHDALAFARETRVLLVRHEASGIDIDIVFGSLPFEKEIVANAVCTDLNGVKIPLPLPEDLIIMKAVAHRSRDMEDIRAILCSHPKLNIIRVRRRVREFSEALSMPEILNDLDSALSERRKWIKQVG